MKTNKMDKKKTKNELLKEAKELKKQVVEKITALLTAAFGLIAALSWNDTVKAIFKKVFGSADNIPGMIIYATTVTVIAVIVTIELGKISKRLE